MSAEISRCYELLGVKPGVSAAELKAAYRDMAKVWHPDRFGHDERLQKKAQEKLKEINEAYEVLIAGKVPRPTASASAKSRETYSTPNDPRSRYTTSTPATARSKPFSWQWVVVPLLIFGAVFFLTSRTLLRSAQSSASQVSSQETQPTELHAAANPADAQKASDDSSRNRNRPESELSESSISDVRANEVSATPLQPMKTVTVLIDPATGLLARADCPVKTRVSYPAGNEPHGSCAAVHAKATDESRVKAVAKRVVSPGKWLGGSKEKSEGDPQE